MSDKSTCRFDLMMGRLPLAMHRTPRHGFVGGGHGPAVWEQAHHSPRWVVAGWKGGERSRFPSLVIWKVWSVIELGCSAADEDDWSAV
jgi:hypothetical protein